MQLHQLQTFVTAAECGSFLKAAEKTYVTNSAVVQQINNLESSLGAKLFIRSSHGVKLTPVGEYVFEESRELLRKSKEIEETVMRMEYENDTYIILGSGLRQNCNLFYSLWGRFASLNDKYQVRTMDVTDLSMLTTMSRKPDLIEGIQDGESWQKDYSFLYMCKDKIACAVPKTHPLASKKYLTYKEIKPYTLIVGPEQLGGPIETIKTEAAAAGVEVRHAEVYNIPLFTECYIKNWLVQIPESWGYMCKDFVIIPCEWSAFHNYGFFYHEPVNRPLQEFLKFVRKEQLSRLPSSD